MHLLFCLYSKGHYRDPFPKMDLYGGFIGDKVPMCVDIPDKHFLKKGATYRLLGSSPQPDLHEYGSHWHEDKINFQVNTDGILMLDSSSNLRSKLVNKNIIVSLDSTIPCSGDECNVDSLSVVQIEQDPPIYYEYVPPKCVELSFYEGSKKITKEEWHRHSMCANPNLNAAFDVCCERPNDPSWRLATPLCRYDFERTTLSTAQTRCLNHLNYPNGDLCDFHFLYRSFQDTCATDQYLHWDTVSHFFF